MALSDTDREDVLTVPPASLPTRFWPYLISRIVSVTGDGAALAALAIAVYDRNPSALAVAGLFIARVLPRLAGPFTGHLADRTELRRLMRLCDGASAIIFGLIAWLQSPHFALLAFVMLAELCAATSVPATRTAVTRIVPTELLGRANAWITTALALGLTVGASVGGLLVAQFGPWIALGINAASFTVAVGLARFVPRMHPTAPEPGAPSDGALRAVRSNVARLWSHRDARVVVIGLITVVFCASLDRPAVVFLTQSVLHTGPAGYGTTLAMIGIGVLIAGLLVRFGVIKLSATVFIAAICLQGLAHIAMGLASGLLFLAATMLIAGVGNGLESVAGMTLIQRAVPKETVGGSMGVVMSAMFLADAVGSLVSAWPISVTSPRVAFYVAGTLMIAVLGTVTVVSHTGESA
jgi:MFS family permease